MHPELSKRLVMLQLGEALSDARLFNSQVQLEEVGYPTFFIRFVNKRGAVRLLRFDCSNYDFVAMGVEPVDPITREPLSPENWMRRQGGMFPGHHMRCGRPFLCLKGTRDYYTHEGHRPSVTNERWEQHRVDMKIRDVIAAIKEHFYSGAWE